MPISSKLLSFLQSLTKDEQIELTAHLIEEIEEPDGRIDSRIFRAILPKFPSIPIELMVLDEDDKVLMIYRKDIEYDGFHIPGTVLRNNETVPQAVDRLFKSEVISGTFTSVENVGMTEISKGTKPGDNPTRHEVSLLYLAHIKAGSYKGDGTFFPIDDLPENTLSHHVVLIDKFKNYLNTRKPVMIGS